MIATNSPTVYEKLCRLRTHGITREPRYRPARRRQPWYYEKLELGNHYRMTDIQAALGRSQLKKIMVFQNKREKIAEAYSKSLHHLPLDLPRLTPGARSSWHLFPVCVRKGAPFRDKVLSRLHQSGVMGNLHYLCVPSFKFYQRTKRNSFPLPLSKKLARQEISLPIFPNLEDVSLQKVVSTLGAVLR